MQAKKQAKWKVHNVVKMNLLITLADNASTHYIKVRNSPKCFNSVMHPHCYVILSKLKQTAHHIISRNFKDNNDFPGFPRVIKFVRNKF